MIETATALHRPQGDAGYKAWDTAVRKSVMRRDLNDRTAGPSPAFGRMIQDAGFSAQNLGHAYAPASAMDGGTRPDIDYAGDTATDDFSFDDVIDIVNPLQHLPIIGTLYRKFTGDTLKPMSNIIGGAIFGGPLGAVSSTVNVIIKDRTGKDIAENALSFAGISTGPHTAPKPDITYDASLLAENAGGGTELAGTTLALANLSIPADGRKNFAGVRPASVLWNT